MKSVRGIFILSSVIAVASVGAAFFLMLAGPDAIPIQGKSLPELLQNEDTLPLFIIPAVLIISAISILPFLRIIFPGEIKNGITAQAKVLKVWDTGVSINDNPQVGLLLEVYPLGGSPYQVESKTLVSRLNVALVQPGVTAEVVYDPEKPQRLKVETLHIKAAAAVDPSDRMEELNDMRDKHLITEDEYRQKREEILKLL